MNNEKVRLGVIGCGNRGAAYSNYALSHPEEVEVICACDIRSDKLKKFSDIYSVNENMRFLNIGEMLETVDNVDLMIVSNLDAGHFEAAKMILERGIDCLLEKPMSPDAWECLELVRIANENNCHLLVGHVLRYTPFFSTIKELVDKDAIGNIVSVHHAENVSYTHITHSYVRGNFRNLSPIILAKSCHDLDILNWIIGKKCKSISSFGELTYFKEENAPAGCAKRCTECAVEQECPFSALKLYLTDNIEWPTSMISVDSSLQARKKALEEGDYGRCVYHCDNDVADHQIVNMLYEDDVTVSFNLNGFNSTESREIRILGTKGDLHGNMEENYITIRNFGKAEEITIRPEVLPGAHNGGDVMLMKDIIGIIKHNSWDKARTGAEQSVDSHIMAFAAELSRNEKIIVDIEEYKRAIIRAKNM